MRENDDLKFYAFDYDDNLLFMPTEIILLNDNMEEVGMATHDYATYRTRIGKEIVEYKGHNIIGYAKDSNGLDDISSTFRNFRDNDDSNVFIKDTAIAIESKSFGPSWDDFIECLLSGAIFAIITARGHESVSIRKAIENIIDDYLTIDQKHTMYVNLLKYVDLFGESNDGYTFIKDEIFTTNTLVVNYLDLCEYIGVSAPSRMNQDSAINPEDAKLSVLIDFNKRINIYAGSVGKMARIGFSDDDVKTVYTIEKLFNSVNHEEFPHIAHWVVKNTNSPTNITKLVKIK